MATKFIMQQDEQLLNFQSVFTNLGDNIAIIDSTYKIIFQNTLSQKIHSLQLGTQCYKGFRNQPIVCPDCPAQKVFQGAGVSKSEQIYSNKENGEQWLELIASPLTDSEGEIMAAIIVQRDVTAARRMTAERELLIQQLQETVNKLRNLNGVVSICMFCKKIRDENQEWSPIETFLRHRLDFELNHGLCLECGQKHYPAFTT
jgi:hypothetical protein